MTEPFISVAIELPWVCPKCKQPLLLNGVTQSVHCHSCTSLIETPAAFWTRTLESAVGYALGFSDAETTTMSIMGDWGAHSLVYGKVAVHCCAPSCGRPSNAAEVSRSLATGDPTYCGGCGELLRVRAAPAWFRAAVHPRIAGLVGERHASDTAAVEDPSSLRFHCYGCGAGVPLEGAKRNVVCTYCSADLMIPDALWARLHPAPTLSRWFVLIEANDGNTENEKEGTDEFASLRELKRS